MRGRGLKPLFDTGWGYPVDDEYHRQGLSRLGGVDEVGRGALAGPLVTAAVILDRAAPIAGIRDSKQLSPNQRRRLADEIHRNALAWAVDLAPAEEVDGLNVLEATRVSMCRAIRSLVPAPELVLVDAIVLSGLDMPAQGIVRGDRLARCIGAASIVAKVARDEWMTEAARRFPGYGFERHKGYGTPAHLAALRQLGPCPLHRRTFQPVVGMM